jgi:histidine triad (HIT) family protein
MADAPDCVFCRLIAGSNRGTAVLENDAVLAFMDQRQPSSGHVLVVPKLHVQTIHELSPQAGADCIDAMIRLSRALRAAFPADGLSMWQSNGPGAHQEVPHVHFHLMPRHIDDGLLRVYPGPVPKPERDELTRQAALIRNALSDVS